MHIKPNLKLFEMHKVQLVYNVIPHSWFPRGKD